MQEQQAQISWRTKVVKLFLSLRFRIVISVLLVIFHVMLWIPAFVLTFVLSGFFGFVYASLVAILSACIIVVLLLVAAVLLRASKFHENFGIIKGIVTNSIHTIIVALFQVVDLSLVGVIALVPASTGYYVYFALAVVEIVTAYVLIQDMFM